MKDNSILPGDPKITAYALGELTGDERAAVEATLRKNPALRMAVEEIRATAAQIEAAFSGEPVLRPYTPTVGDDGIVILLNGRAFETKPNAAADNSVVQANGRQVAAHAKEEYRLPHSRKKLIRFPEFYYVVATAAAACFAVLVALHDTPPRTARTAERTIRREIVLAPVIPSVSEPSDVAVVIPAPLEPRVASVALPPITQPAPSEPAVESEPARADAGSVGGTAFIEGNLSLVSQSKPEGETPSRNPLPNTAEEVPPGFFPRDRGINPAQTVAGTDHRPNGSPFDRSTPSVGFDNTNPHSGDASPIRGGLLGQSSLRLRSIESSTSHPPTRPLFSDALAPPVAGPVVAGSTLPSVLPNHGSGARASGATAVAPGAGDVVMLSPYTVTAERATGFATSPGAGVPSDKRGAPGRDDRPYPPPGAKFGRNTESYSYIRDNDFLPVANNQLSTFSIDVDTASYANARRIIEHGSLPPRDAVRIEEMLNYFPYRYALPKGDAPFAASLEVAEAPWAPTHRLVRIGLKAREVSTLQRPAASLVFLLDVSGSMNQPNKLPLVKQSLRLLLGKLRADDRVAIVTYAGNSGLALPSTPVAHVREIMNALEALTPSGSANGAMGIQLAYDVAKTNFMRNGINRVILCTDGDFNVGTTSEGELVRLVEEKAISGVFLTVLGFGMGNYKDATLEKLADKGNGNYGYIDTRREAEKLLVEQIGSTLVTVGKDVKVQVEFNPATVSSYRLIGYENRLLRKEDFNNDNVDAGEIGAGHTVTALYEIIPVGAEARSNGEVALDELRYGARGAVSSRLETPSGKRDPLSNELLVVNVRYKKPNGFFSFSKKLEFPLLNAATAFTRASADFRFAAAVAQFGMILRGSPYRGTANLDDVATWAASAAATAADDPGGYRAEFVELVRKAQAMTE